jgi:hypothetical protein
MARTSNRFTKGSAAFTCRACGRLTRDTGRGDNEGVSMCSDCFDLGGEENHLSDNGSFYDSASNVLALIASVAAKGGDASVWDHLKATALNLTQPKENEMNAAELNKAKMPALVAFYNERSGKKAITKFADLATARKRCVALLPKEEQPAKVKPAKAKAAPKAPSEHADRSAAISASWKDPAVHAKRIERTAVKVAGQEFPSVRTAFLALSLPLSRHIRFRIALKASGAEVFEHEGKKYKFAVVSK